MKIKNRWIKLARSFGVDPIESWEKLSSAYTEDGRYWHNLSHIEDCIFALDSASPQAQTKTLLEFALFFHDIVYDPHRSDNEEQSAEVALLVLKDFPEKQEIARLILATKHTRFTPERSDEELIIDIDLSVLGASPERYKEYSQAIRKEYQWVPESEYSEGRRKLLRSFLDRPSIYSTTLFQEQFENQARANIAWEIETLSQ